jgi:hypothetical protein
MASTVGGEKISCEGFDDFEIIFNKKLSSTIGSSNKIIVDINDKHLYDFVFSITNDGNVLLYNVNDGKILVNSDVSEIHYFGEKEVGVASKRETALYAAIYVLSDKLLNDDAERIFYALGDQYHYKELVGAYGKQKLNSFKSAIKECITDMSKRFPDGKSNIKPVDPNTYCLMN